VSHCGAKRKQWKAKYIVKMHDRMANTFYITFYIKFVWQLTAQILRRVLMIPSAT